jgi:hypothetical protein
MDQLGKGIDVRGFELGQVAIAEDLQGEVVLKRQFGQDIHIGGIAGLRFLDDGKSQLFEENLPELLGGVDVEHLSGKLVNAFHLLLKLTLHFL